MISRCPATGEGVAVGAAVAVAEGAAGEEEEEEAVPSTEAEHTRSAEQKWQPSSERSAKEVW